MMATTLLRRSCSTLKRRSLRLTGDTSKAGARGDAAAPGSYVKTSAARANLRACGWGEEDFKKPIVTVGSPWSNALPCNNHLRELTDELCLAIEREGGMPFVCGTPVISDGETNGSEAMKYSLPSRYAHAHTVHHAYAHTAHTLANHMKYSLPSRYAHAHTVHQCTHRAHPG